MFKVGDWVREYDKYSDDITISQLSEYDICTIGRGDSFNTYEKWEPKEGEWCWFTIIDGYALPPLLMQYGEQDVDRWNIIEPFIGELPSFVKETNGQQ